MKRLAALLICLAALIPAAAQDAPPVITPDNAAALTMLESAGSALPVSVQFSPDGRYIVATTTDEIFVYPSDDPDAAPQIFPFDTYSFDDDGFFVTGGQRWNLDTGLSIGIPPSLRMLRESAGGPAVIEIVKPGGEKIRVPTAITDTITGTAVNDDYSVLAVASEGDFLHRIHPTVYLYRLPTGQQIAALPHGGNGDPITSLFFTRWGETSLLIAESSVQFHSAEGYVELIFADTGQRLPEYSGKVWNGTVHSSKGAFAYGIDGQIVYGTGSVIDIVPYRGQLETLIIGDRGIASLTADGFRAALFGEDGRIGELVEYESYSGFSIWPLFVGEHIFFTVQDALWIWDVASPDAEPRSIEIERGTHAITFSPYLERYSYLDQDNRRFVRDASTNEILSELPAGVVFSPDWSRVTYFNGKLLTVDDFADEQDYLRQVSPRHLGEVADFQNGFAAFVGDALQVVDLDPADGRTDTITIDGPFGGAQFFGGGACILTFAPSNGGMQDTVIHRLNTEAVCDPDEYLTNFDGSDTVVTPDGRFLVGYSTYCDSPYAYPSANVYPLRGQPSGELPNILHVMFGCGRHAFTFAPDGETIYFADGMLRRGKFSSDGSMLLDEDLVTLLDYGDPVDYSYARIVGVFLSPDEQTIAVYVEDSKGSDWVQERYIEVFALDDLAPGTLRRNVRPLQIIPDATVAYFSPDGRYVATDQGLYAVEFFNQTPAVRGTISAFSPDSQFLATFQGGYVTLWRVPQPSAANYPLAQYEIGGVRELAFSDDGTRLYVVRAGEVQAWGIAR